jgi:hypothetical protein
MEDPMRNPRYEEARVLPNAGLGAINLLTSPERIWFGFPMLGWGIGLLAHGLSVFAFRGWFGPQWEERKIREYLDRR